MDADIGIVGGGLAGSLAAAMLGRAGLSTILFDGNVVYPRDFRCEKLDETQLGLLQKTGLAEGILRAATPIRRLWVARSGRVVRNRPNHQIGIAYPTLVNATRALIAGNVTQIFHKVGDIRTGPVTQKITTSSGETFAVRLVILATGLSNNLRQNLGISRDNLSKCHSISIGFDVASNDPSGFEFEALTYFPESIASRMCYLTLFPIGSSMRANVFIYRDRDGGWLDEFRAAPQRVLLELMPKLHHTIGDFSLASDVHVRPTDLYRTSGYQQPGVVIVGDSFATSCPAAGTGVNKVLVDVERLCNVYIPQWLATTGMDADKIAAFYADAEKVASDVYSESHAYYMRSLSVDAEVRWRVRRWGWLMLDAGRGLLSQRQPSFPAAAATPIPTGHSVPQDTVHI